MYSRDIYTCKEDYPKMTLDLQHNRIVKDTMTEKFAESVRENLMPMLVKKYGECILGIQMYEDYIADKFLRSGCWYYPLTLIMIDGPKTEWIRWDADKALYSGTSPYSYVGDKLIDFKFATPTEEFENKLVGRAIYDEGGHINVRIDAAIPDITFLSGKYSQTFIDEMARQITKNMCEAMNVASFDGSSIELSLVFAPETYMEHTSENVTYRRLLLVDKSSAPRDFWIKWSRLDGATAYTIADNVTADNVVFEIGEDVSQKAREKEYRCLLRLGKDKYHTAMGRKNVTEWRDVIKRAIRRGELVQIDEIVEDSAKNDEISAQLAKLLGTEVPVAASSEPEQIRFDDELEIALRKLANVAGGQVEEELPVEEVIEEVAAEEPVVETEAAAPAEEQTSDNFVFAGFDVPEVESTTDIFAAISADDTLMVDERGMELPTFEAIELDEVEETEENVEAVEETADDIIEEVIAKPEAVEEAPAAEPAPEVEASAVDVEAKIRAELEAKIRLEYESRARIKAEEEAERLRREQEILRLEHEKLQAQLARERREQAIKEEELRAEEARLRAQIELRLRAETRERERLAEAARVAVEEQRRLEAEHAKLTAEHAAEERRAAAEAKRVAAEADKARREKQAAARAKVAAAAEDPKYTYTSKVVRLVFRRSVDPNITQRIHEIIKVTLEYYGKDKIYLKIKATVPDSETVCLEFVKIPLEEMELLGNIIKVLGNSGLGIAKAIVE